MKFPFSVGHPSTSFRVRVPDSVTCNYVVFCSLTNEYAYAEARWKSFVSEWLERQSITPLTGAVSQAVTSRDLKIAVQRVAELQQRVIEPLEAMRPAGDGMRRIHDSCHGLVIQGKDSLRYPRSRLWAAHAAARALAEHMNGVPVDIDTLQVLNANVALSTMHVAGVPRIRHFLSISNQSGKAKIPRFITQGMARFGLPELELQTEYPIPEAIAMEFILAVAQKLTSEMMALITSAGSPGDRIRLPLEITLSSEEPWSEAPRSLFNGSRPADSLTVRLRPPGAPGRSDGILLRPPRDYPGDARGWLEAAARLISGTPLPTDPLPAEHVSPIGAAELADARRTFDGDGGNCPPLSVRYRASTPYGPDYRWIAVTSWSGRHLRGHNVATPDQPPDYMAGRISEVDERDIVELSWMEHASRR